MTTGAEQNLEMHAPFTEPAAEPLSRVNLVPVKKWFIDYNCTKHK